MGGQREREKAWVKGVDPYLLIKAANIKSLPTRLKTRLFPKGPCRQHGWITHAHNDKDPVIRGHDLCLSGRVNKDHVS